MTHYMKLRVILHFCLICKELSHRFNLCKFAAFLKGHV
jgi:hypothetical protein